jgi:hypothetical protein
MSIIILLSLLMTGLFGPDKYKAFAMVAAMPTAWYVLYAYKSFGILS